MNIEYSFLSGYLFYRKEIGIMKKFSLITLFLILSTPAFAQEEKSSSDWNFKGQVLLRGEFDGRDFDNKTNPITATQMRTRLSAEKELIEKTYFFLQIEDSRIFGGSGNSISNLKNLDMHQGFLNFNNPFSTPISVQLGRFEMDYSNGRFFSALPGWNYIGRSFDGARVKYNNTSFFDFKFDAFSLVVNSERFVTNATPANYSLPTPPDLNNALYGFWSSINFSEQAKFDIFTYYEDNRKQTVKDFNDLNRFTSGITYTGNYGEYLSSVVDLALQKGMVSNKEQNSYLASAQLAFKPNDFKFIIGSDLLSGNNPNSKKTNNSFSPSFGNNHAYYGYMDYFINLPDNTKNLGLRDFYFKTSWENKDNPLSVKLDLHHLMSDQVDISNNNTYGQEGDLTLNYKYSDKGTIIFGASSLNQGNLFASNDFFGKDRKDLSYWAYLMTIYNF